MKRLSLPILILASSLSTASAQDAEGATGLPKYGGIEGYETLWEKAAEADRPKSKANSEDADRKGWEAMRVGDGEKAMRRFNQAWTLWPENPNPLWGMGIVIFEQTIAQPEGDQAKTLSQFDKAIALMEEAKALAPKRAPLLTDLARIYASRGAYRRHAKASGTKEDFKEAESLLTAAEKIEGPHPQIESTWETLERHRGNGKKADAHAAKVKELTK